MREWLINEHVLGPTGIGNPNVSAIYLDDSWSNSTNPRKCTANGTGPPGSGPAPGVRKGACDCDSSPFGGPTEESYYCVQDMGLTQAETTAITDGWKKTMQVLQDRVIKAGAW